MAASEEKVEEKPLPPPPSVGVQGKTHDSRLIGFGPKCPPELHRKSVTVTDFVLHKLLYQGPAFYLFESEDKMTGTSCLLKHYRIKGDESAMKQIIEEIKDYQNPNNEAKIQMYMAWKEPFSIYLALEYEPGDELMQYMKFGNVDFSRKNKTSYY